MRVEYILGGLAPLGPVALTIGTFDGVHRGHQELLARAAEVARERGLQAVALTFWPQPVAVLQPEVQVVLLSMLDERVALLAATGMLDAVVVMPFTSELAALSPAAFLDRIAVWCEPRIVIEGPDFALGNGRRGDLAFLREEGARRGFAVESLTVEDAGERISSTRIRALLAANEFGMATRLLGHPYTIWGEVVTGDQRGRLLGFPTANLRLDPRKALPANGIYAVRVGLPGEARATHPGVASIGVRPTFGRDPRPLVEIHLFDTTIDLYGVTLAVEVVAWLREERRYADVEALIAQMTLDAQQARKLLMAASTSSEHVE